MTPPNWRRRGQSRPIAAASFLRRGGWPAIGNRTGRLYRTYNFPGIPLNCPPVGRRPLRFATCGVFPDDAYGRSTQSIKARKDMSGEKQRRARRRLPAIIESLEERQLMTLTVDVTEGGAPGM